MMKVILFNEDYPNTRLEKGKYLFVITNDIRYIETNYSIGLNVSVLDWRFVNENIEEQINFGLITAQQVALALLILVIFNLFFCGL